MNASSIPSRLVLALVALAATCGSARDLGWSELLASYPVDLSLLSARERVRELDETDGLQLWDKVEFRYAAKRSDLRKQEFGIRLSPTGLGEFSANRDLAARRRALGASKLDEKTAEALRDRYRLALRWLRQSRQMRYHQDMKELCELRISTLSRLVGDPRFDPRDLVETQVDRTEYASRIEGDRYELDQTAARMRELVPGCDSIRIEGSLLSPLEIQQRLEILPATPNDSFPRFAVASKGLDLAEARSNLEIAGSRRWLSYLDAGYTVDVDENRLERKTIRDNISFGAGIRIPVFDGSSADVARRKADLVAARLEFQDDRENLARQIEEARLEIGSMLRQMSVLDSFAAKVDAGGLFANFAARTGSDPLLLLRARSTSLQSAWRLDGLRFQIFDRYLDILHISGALLRHPGRNLLLAETPQVTSGLFPGGKEPGAEGGRGEEFR